MQLAWGAHHDAITGSESDQVYLDLLTGWRDAWEIGAAAALGRTWRCCPARWLPSGRSVVVWNPLAHNRTDVVTVRLDDPVGLRCTVLDSRRRRGVGVGR